MWDLGGKWLIHRGIHNKLMKYVPRLFLLFVVLMAATAVHAQSLCTVSGVVYAPDGSTIDNGTVTFTPAGQVPQIIGGQAIYPKYVSTTTDSSGNLVPISLIQGAAMNVTICQAGGSACSALVYVSVPAESSVSFALLLANTQISYSTVPINDLAQPATGNYDMGGFGFLNLDELIGVAAGLNIQGNSITGTDNLANFNVNGVQNVQTYGAVCSATTVNVTTVGSSPTVVASGSVGDFKVGQNVVIPLAGATSTIATPTLTTAELDGYLLNPAPTPPVVFNGTAAISDSCLTDSSSSPYTNASCTTTYGYNIQNVAFDGSTSTASATVYVTDGPATISLANAIALSWTTDPAAIATIVKRCTGVSCTPTSIIKVYPNLPVGQVSGGVVFFADQGNPYGHTEYPLLNTAQAGIFTAQIVAIDGLNVTLSAAPPQSGTFTMSHDDEPSFSAAEVAAIQAPGGPVGSVDVPACAVGYNFGQTNSLYGFSNLIVEGKGIPVTGGPSVINWLGPLGGIVFNMNFAAYVKIENIGVPSGSSNNTPGIVFDLDKYTGPGPGGNPGNFTPSGAQEDQLNNDECGESGVCVWFGGVSNVSENSIDHISCDAPNGFGGFACFDSASQETYSEQITSGEISQRDFGVGGWPTNNLNLFGSLIIKNVDFEHNVIDVNAAVDAGGWISIEDCDSEGAQESIHNASFVPLRIDSSRLSPQPGPDGYFLVGGGITLENSSISGATGFANMALQTSNGGLTNTLINDSFAVGLASTTAAYPVQPYALPVTDLGGGQAQPPYTAINNSVVNVSARYARDGISAPIEMDFTGPLSAWESKTIGFNCSTNLTIPTNFTGPTSSATCGTSPSETDAYTVAINGTTVGTITTQTSCSTTPAAGNVVLGSATATTCTPGQRLTVTAPATASGSDLFLSLQATQ